MRKSRSSKFWTPAVTRYIVDHYVGTQPSERREGVVRRAFMWEDGQNLVEGNLAAFTVHLCQFFGIPAKKWTWTQVDKILVAEGHRVREFMHRPGSSGDRTSMQDPESRVVGRVKGKKVVAKFMVTVFEDGSREIVDV